jgi:hypothetical protein
MLREPRYNLLNDIIEQKRALFAKFEEISLNELPNQLNI